MISSPGDRGNPVCSFRSVSRWQIRKREVGAMADAMAELKLWQGIIVTRTEEELIQVKSGKIDVVPAWRFLLNVA